MNAEPPMLKEGMPPHPDPVENCIQSGTASQVRAPKGGEGSMARLELAYARGRARARFRGGVLENLKGTAMGKGHGNDGRPFDINTANYLRPIFAKYDEAIRSGRRCLIVEKGGVKTLKSYALEACGLDHVNNRRGDAAIYFGSEQSAEDTSSTRILDHYRGNARFAEKLESLRSRFDETMGAVKFPDKTLYILSANLGNTQQKNLGFMGIQDAFVTKKTGMIKEALARTTQYQDAIIFIESQGGEKGFDFDELYEETDQGELYVICPACGSKHVFNWKAWDERHMTRPEGFMPKAPRIIPSLDHEAWIAHHRPLMAGKCAGYQFKIRAGSAAAKAMADGSARQDEFAITNNDGPVADAIILRDTHFECYHCGEIWRDTPGIRNSLDESSFYVPANAGALANECGFNFPQWINTRLPWGPMMVEKVRAQAKASDFGNYLPLQQWWQKTAARTWDPDLPARQRMLAVTLGSYETDPSKLSYGADTVRQMTVDCGKRIGALKNEPVIGKLFFEVRDFGPSGSSKQLARGMVESWELLAAQAKYWKVPANRVGVDCAWMPSQVQENAVKFFEVAPTKFSGREAPFTWVLLEGAGEKRMSVNSKGVGFLRQTVPGMRTGHIKGKLWKMWLSKTSWANLWFEQQLESIMHKTVKAQWEILERDKVMMVDLEGSPSENITRKYLEEWERETDSYHGSWEQQLNSRYISERTGKFEDYDKASRPTEARDLALMHLVLQAMEGGMGHGAS